MTVQQRTDQALERIRRLGATPTRIVLTEADYDRFGDGGPAPESYDGVPVAKGQIGGSSYVETRGAPSGETNFAID